MTLSAFMVPVPQSEPYVGTLRERLELTLRLARAFPDYPPHGGQHPSVVPHLTVAQADALSTQASAAAEAEAEAELRAVLPRRGGVKAWCREVMLIENSSGRWQPMHVFPLGAKLGRIEGG